MVNFYESNANFYNSSAFLTTTLMDYLRVSVGKTVRVVFPRISKFTDFTYLEAKAESSGSLWGEIHILVSLHLLL